MRWNWSVQHTFSTAGAKQKIREMRGFIALQSRYLRHLRATGVKITRRRMNHSMLEMVTR